MLQTVEVQLWRVRLVITAASPESEGTYSEAVCGMWDGFPMEAPRGVLPSVGGSSGQP